MIIYLTYDMGSRLLRDGRLVTLLAFFPIKGSILSEMEYSETELGLDSHSPKSITIFQHTKAALFYQ